MKMLKSITLAVILVLAIAACDDTAMLPSAKVCEGTEKLVPFGNDCPPVEPHGHPPADHDHDPPGQPVQATQGSFEDSDGDVIRFWYTQGKTYSLHVHVEEGQIGSITVADGPGNSIARNTPIRAFTVRDGDNRVFYGLLAFCPRRPCSDDA